MSDSDKLRAALERAECNLVQIEQRAHELIVR